MIQTLEALRDAVKGQGSKTLAVAAAGDAEVLLAVDMARRLGIASAILVGDEEKIRTIAAQRQIPLEAYRLIPESREAWEEVGVFLRIIYGLRRSPSGKAVRRVKSGRFTPRKKMTDI